MNLASLGERNIETFGEYPALHFKGTWHTNVEWAAGVRRFANLLEARGIGRGDRVATLMPNAVEVFHVIGGTLAVGGVVLPIVFLLAPEEVRHIVADARPKLLVTTPLFIDKVTPALEGLEDPPEVLVVGEPVPEGASSYEAALEGLTDAHEITETDDDEIALLMYTGGTTGTPKGVEISHGNLSWNATTVAEAVGLERGEVSLLCLPVSHLFGLFAAIFGQTVGLRGVMLEWFTPDDTLRAIEEHGVTYAAMVPTMLTMLLHHPTADDHDTGSLRMIFASAAPVPVELAEAFEKRFDCEVLEAYGQTEAAPAIAINPPGSPRKAGSTGKPLPGLEVRIVGEDGQDLPPGEVGEILARGPGIMRGYRNLPEETAETLAGGWLHTGDLGTLDAEGYLFVTGRARDLIIRGGENVFPHDVEEVLLEHPGVMEVAVVGKPDERLGEEVVAFVVKVPGQEVTEEDLLARCEGRLASFKAPKEIHFRPELPKSPIGKVLKRELRASLGG